MEWKRKVSKGDTKEQLNAELIHWKKTVKLSKGLTQEESIAKKSVIGSEWKGT